MRETYPLRSLPRALSEVIGIKVYYQKLYRMIIDGYLNATQAPNKRWLIDRADVDVIAAKLTQGK